MSRSPPHTSAIVSTMPKEVIVPPDCSVADLVCVSLSESVWSFISWDLRSVKINGIFSQSSKLVTHDSSEIAFLGLTTCLMFTALKKTPPKNPEGHNPLLGQIWANLALG